MPEVVDLKWLHIEEPQPGETVLDRSGSRVWYLATGRDVSGAVSLGMSEEHALTLCGAGDKEEFQRKHSEGALNMPLFCHARVSRNLRDGNNSASQPIASQRGKFVNHNIEAIEPVSWHPQCSQRVIFGCFEYSEQLSKA